MRRRQTCASRVCVVPRAFSPQEFHFESEDRGYLLKRFSRMVQNVPTMLIQLLVFKLPRVFVPRDFGISESTEYQKSRRSLNNPTSLFFFKLSFANFARKRISFTGRRGLGVQCTHYLAYLQALELYPLFAGNSLPYQ